MKNILHENPAVETSLIFSTSSRYLTVILEICLFVCSKQTWLQSSAQIKVCDTLLFLPGFYMCIW